MMKPRGAAPAATRPPMHGRPRFLVEQQVTPCKTYATLWNRAIGARGSPRSEPSERASEDYGTEVSSYQISASAGSGFRCCVTERLKQLLSQQS